MKLLRRLIKKASRLVVRSNSLDLGKILFSTSGCCSFFSFSIFFSIVFFFFFLKRRKFYQIDTIFLMKILKPNLFIFIRLAVSHVIFCKTFTLVKKWNLIENSRVYFFFSSSCRLCKAFGDIFFFFSSSFPPAIYSLRMRRFSTRMPGGVYLWRILLVGWIWIFFPLGTFNFAVITFLIITSYIE